MQTAIFLPIIFTSLLNYLITDIQTAKYEKINSMRSSWCRTGPFQSPDGADLVQNVDGSVWIQCGVVQNWGDTHLFDSPGWVPFTKRKCSVDLTGCNEIEEIGFNDGMNGKNSGWNSNQDFKIMAFPMWSLTRVEWTGADLWSAWCGLVQACADFRWELVGTPL